MSLAATPIIPRDGVFTLYDGGVLSLAILYMGGALKITGLNASQKAKQTFMSGGTMYAARDVDDQLFGLEFVADAVQFLGDGTTATLFEALMRKGVWSAATSTLPAAAGDVYCLKGIWTVNRTSFGASANNTVTAKYVQFDVDFGEGSPSQFTVKGQGYPYSTDFLTWT